MGDNIFTNDNHVASWVLHPVSWGGEPDIFWTKGFNKEQLARIFNHIKSCLSCRQMEIEAVLQWATLPSRIIYSELIPIESIAETRVVSIAAYIGAILPLVEQLKSVSQELNIVLSNLDIIEKRFSEIREKLRVTNCTIADNIEILIQILSQAKAGIE
jgi:hypothetical protein